MNTKTNQPQRPEPMWIVDGKGKVVKMDWDQIEGIADRHKKLMHGMHLAFDMNFLQMGMFACLIVAVRDYVLETAGNAPAIPKAKKPEPKSES